MFTQTALACLRQIFFGTNFAYSESTGFYKLLDEIKDIVTISSQNAVSSYYNTIMSDLSYGIEQIKRQMFDELTEQQTFATVKGIDCISDKYDAFRDHGGLVVGTIFGRINRGISQDKNQQKLSDEISALTNIAKQDLQMAIDIYCRLTKEEERLAYITALRSNNAEMLSQFCNNNFLQAQAIINAWNTTNTGQLFVGTNETEGIFLNEAITQSLDLTQVVFAPNLPDVNSRLENLQISTEKTTKNLQDNWVALQVLDVATLMLLGGAVEAAGVATLAQASNLVKISTTANNLSKGTQVLIFASRGVLAVKKGFQTFQKAKTILISPIRNQVINLPGVVGTSGRFLYDLAYYRTIGMTLDVINTSAHKAFGNDSNRAAFVQLLVMMTKLGPSFNPYRIGISAGFEVGIEKLYQEIEKMPEQALNQAVNGHLTPAQEKALKQKMIMWHYIGRATVDVTKILVRRWQRYNSGTEATTQQQVTELSKVLRNNGAVITSGTTLALTSLLRGYSLSLCEVGHFRQPPSVFENYRSSIIKALGSNACPRAQVALREYLDDQLLVLAAERSGLDKLQPNNDVVNTEVLNKSIESVKNDLMAFGVAKTDEEAEKLAREHITNCVLLSALCDTSNERTSNKVIK